MSRRGMNSNDIGCLFAIVFGFLVLGAIGSFLEFAAENIGIVLIILSIVGAVVGVGIVISKANQEKEAEEAEKQRNIVIVNAKETKPRLTIIPTSSDFSNKEEKLINLSFREFLKYNNNLVVAREHLNYLSNKEVALKALGRIEDSARLDVEIKQAKVALSDVQAKKPAIFKSMLLSKFYNDNIIQNHYTTFIHKLPNEKYPIIEDFFQYPWIKVVKAENDAVLIFTPGYVLLYRESTQSIRVIQYKDVSVKTWITTELLKGNRNSDDEIEHIGYLYETKDGRRDMRYSYSNNPSFTYVYRGECTVRCGSISYIKKFTNKSLAEDFEKQFNNYLSIINGKYNTVIKSLLEHNEELLNSSSIAIFIDKLDAAEKKRKAEEKSIAERNEKERKEREAALAEKQKKEKEKLAAKEQEKRRKDEFIKCLTIVDGVLTNWHGIDKHVVIPQGLVTAIGSAFRFKIGLEFVSIPDGVTEIRANAFYETESLKNVTIPNSVSKIGKEAFFGCSSLTEIVLPESIKTITEKMFGKCSSLKKITIPAGVKKIKKGAFYSCSSLSEIIIPEGVRTIEDEAFENCTNLKKVVLPDSVKDFGKNVFSGCVSLEHVILGSGIKRIPEACFCDKQNLVDVTIAFDVVEIEDRAFRNCKNLTTIVFAGKYKTSTDKGMDFERMISGAEKIDNSFALERIGESAFENCYVFTGIELKEGLKTIAANAFADCRAIKSINLPKSVKTIGTGVFAGCTSLNEVTGLENIKWKKNNCFTKTPWLSTQATDGFVVFDGYLEAYTGTDSCVEIPPDVDVIGQSAFEGNSFVSHIQIPNGVESIEEMAFADCHFLKTVFIPDSVRNIENNAFSENTNCIIQCSRGSAASEYRIRKKMRGEYISKAQTEPKERKIVQKSKASADDGLWGLSEEERSIIMDMRRAKIAKKKAEKEKSPIPETTEYVLTQFDPNKVSIKIADDGRKITNNIFNLKFEQSESATERVAAEYETFVVDALGQIISDIKTISATKEGAALTHKVTYSLSAQKNFDKTAEYYVILRYKNAGLNILSKTQYQISIDFASDFDF